VESAIQLTHVLFDLDGTLTDPAPGIVRCLQYALREMGLPEHADTDLTRFIGPPLQESFRKLLGNPSGSDIDRAIGLYRERFAEVGIFENTLFLEVREVLSALREQGYELLVATSKPHVFARRIIDHFGLSDFFAGVYGSELSGERSAKAELIRHVLETQSLPADAACMIGDRRHDIIGAQQNGVSTIGVLWGFGSLAELKAAAPDRIAESIGDLPRLVRELTGNCCCAEGPVDRSPT